MMTNEQKKFNVYEFAGKAGKIMKQVGGYVLAMVVTYAVTNGPSIIKKIRKS